MGPSALVSLLSVSSAVALSACARSSPATVSRRVVATPRAPPQSSPRSGITLDQAPTADPIDLGTVDGRATLWLVAGTRWLVDEHGATSAPHMLDPELVGGVRDARGWLFADETGSLWRSSETLGDMEPAGELTTEPFRPAPSRDVFAWIGPTRPGAQVR